ncbi:MAG: hypothetical protein ORN24_01465, partial [Burkholderiales bacterium]|nr:hypothetical protein [Burkholderiales bacterium]
ELKLYFLNNNLWLLGHNLELESEINYYPILDIVGENVNDYLPTGIGSIQLNKIVNEIQMFLFNSQLNHTRQKNNHLSLNSIWIWNKKINPNTYTNYANVFSNHATLTIEKYSNSIHPLPTNQEDLIQNNSLVIIDNLFYSSCYRDNYTYSQQLEQLDQTLGKFLQQKIADKHIQELNILIPVGKNTIQLRTIQLHKYKFWRNNSLIHFIKEYHAR